jgi:mono/diheme cytochrome c family protein
MTDKKTFLVLTLILVASLILAGCGTTATAEPANTEEPAAQTAPEAAPTEPAPTEAPAEAPTEAATEPAAAAPAGTVSFATDVMPIIDSRCVNCHGGERIEEGLVMTDYSSLLAGSENGPVIVPGDPANSKLVELVASQKMPKRGPKLTPPQVQIIADWVAAGAPNN